MKGNFSHLNCQDLTLKDFLKEFLQIKTIIKVFKRPDPNFECISEVFRKLNTLVFVTKDLPGNEAFCFLQRRKFPLKKSTYDVAFTLSA